MTTDVCHPVHDWYILLSRIFISGIQPLPIIKNIPMVQETRRKQKSTNIAKDCIWFPVVVPKTDTGELNVSPGSAIVEALVNPGTNEWQ